MRVGNVGALVVVAVTAGCSRDDGRVSPTPATESASASAKQPGGDVGTWTGTCAEVVRALQAELAKLPSSCVHDGDCVCYGGGVGGVTDCGGVSSLDAAKRIGALTDRFSQARCSHSVQCSARACKVACVAGACVESPPKLAP